MQHSTMMLGRALSQDELNHSRYLDASIAFRPDTCLRMDGAGSGGDGGAGGGAGDSGSGGEGGQGDGDKGGAGGAGAGGQTGTGGDKGGSDKGFPEGTPIAQMTDAQRAAYWQHQSQKHEGRNRDILTITGGKYGDDLKNIITEHGTLKAATLTDGEKAIEDAKKQTRSEVATENVRSAFELVLPDDMPEEKKTETLAVLNLAAFLTPDGKVDTAKVKTHAATLAPAKDSGQQQRNRDWGGGHRNSSGAPLGAAGASEAERRFGKKSTTTS